MVNILLYETKEDFVEAQYGDEEYVVRPNPGVAYVDEEDKVYYNDNRPE